MAKYNWIELEKEFILGDYKSANAFLKEKGIPRNGSTQKRVQGWGAKKVQKEKKKSSKTIEKVIEKESTKEANEKVTINSVASKLLNRIVTISDKVDNPQGLKSLSSALNDINSILSKDESKESKLDKLLDGLESAINDDK